MQSRPRRAQPAGLRLAIRDLSRRSRRDISAGRSSSPGWTQLEARLPACKPEETGRRRAATRRSLRREALVANPLVSGQPIVFVVRHQYRSHYHAIDTLFHTGELNADRGMTPHAELFQGGGALKTIDLRHRPGPHAAGDGRRASPAIRRSISTAGGSCSPCAATATRTITSGRFNADGTRPAAAYGGRGRVGLRSALPARRPHRLLSTREPKYNQCSRDHGANLFRMEPDGANIRQIGKNNLFDNHGALTPDGRILYARWEYVDRNFGDAHGIWTVNPDGTNQAIYWGNNTASPGAVYYPRIIPGTQQLLCVFGMHHFRLWGALAIVDRQRGLDGREPVLRTWPPERDRAGPRRRRFRLRRVRRRSIPSTTARIR